MPTYPESEDPFGCVLLDHLEQKTPRSEFILESSAGGRMPAMPPEWFFYTPEQWHPWERRQLEAISGPVLDLGCGAGRASLFLQQRGLEVTAVDASPGAIKVCQARGIRDARVGDLREPPRDKDWAAILLLCGNLGLAGGWEETRALLTTLAEISRHDAVLITDTVDPTVGLDPDSENRRFQLAQVDQGRYEGQIGLRLHYGGMSSPWWEQSNILIADVPRLISGTGWQLSEHHLDGADHYLALSKQGVR